MKMLIQYLLKLSLLPIFIFFLVFNSSAQEITPPSCYGNSRQMREFIEDEMVYPEQAITKGKEGKVMLSYIVNADGTVQNIRIEHSVSPAIDAEAIRLFRHILWHPATRLGKPVRYHGTFTIPFKIKKYRKILKNRGVDYLKLPYEPVDTSFTVYDRKAVDSWPKPVFNSLDRDLSTFLGKNLKYPDAAFKQNISGTVKLRYVVEPNGHISNIEVIEGVGGGCTEEAIRVLKLIKWFPGIKDNQAVRTFMTMEITFDISKKTVGGAIPLPGQIH